MKIILNNEIELNVIGVDGGPMYIQGSDRDTLSFIFPDTEDMNELDAIFSPTYCESICIIGDDGSEGWHHGYTIRAKLEKFKTEVSPATSNSEAVTEGRIVVSMSQRTYMENQIASLTDTVDVLVMESLMSDMDLAEDETVTEVVEEDITTEPSNDEIIDVVDNTDEEENNND